MLSEVVYVYLIDGLKFAIKLMRHLGSYSEHGVAPTMSSIHCPQYRCGVFLLCANNNSSQYPMNKQVILGPISCSHGDTSFLRIISAIEMK